jgi:hypothetical protein
VNEGTVLSADFNALEVLGNTIAAKAIDTLSRPAVEAAEHGAGAIGTAFAPRTYRYIRDGIIITEVEIDLSLSSIRRKYFEMRDESFIHMGERLARAGRVRRWLLRAWWCGCTPSTGTRCRR